MVGKHLYTYVNPPVIKHLEQCRLILEKDGIISYPMEDNWAIGCRASSYKALEKIRLLKPYRPKDQSFSLLCRNLSMIATVANVDQFAYRILRKILPGSYTILLPRNKKLFHKIKDKRRVVGVKTPNNPLILALLEHINFPLVTTSVPPLPSYQVREVYCTPKFGYEIASHLGHGLDLILDLGEELSGLESTILDLTTGECKLIRQGTGDITPIASLVTY